MQLRLKCLCLAIVAIGALTLGCATMSVYDKDENLVKGIPYYMPKPYIVAKQDCSETMDKNKKIIKSEAWEISVVYLPDLSAGLHYVAVNPRLGSANGDFKLENGWQLVSAKVELDSKVSDNVKAATELLGATGSGGAGGTSGLLELAKIVLPSLLNTSSFVPGTCKPKICIYELENSHKLKLVEGLSPNCN